MVERAFKNQELNELFLGIPPYTYIPKFSCAPGNIDLTAIIPDGIFVYVKHHNNSENLSYLNKTLYHLSEKYEGLDAVATYVLCATIYKKNHGKLPIEININELSDKLNNSIEYFKDRLKNDFNGVGFGNPNGIYGDFQRLALIIQQDGGPNFFPEENSQSIKM